ncbi:MAG: Gfo/Idh/MocA family protein [Beutenbergiaceae bacterium]
MVRWGILGPGRIAEKVAADFDHVADGELVAVGSRSLSNAQAFAARHGIARAHGSYAELLDDQQVDAVYVATPHSWHAAHGRAVLHAGKALLMEKAFTATLAGAESVVATARESGTFAMEAMWMRFQPAVVHARELIADGVIGEVRAVQADLGVAREYRPQDRLFALELGGGATLDLGVYLVNLAHMVLGEPIGVHAVGSLLPTGVDREVAIQLEYPDGGWAQLAAAFYAMPGAARIVGTDGWIDIPPRFHHPTSLTLTRTGTAPESIPAPPAGAGYALEFDEVNRCLAAGLGESPVMGLSDTLAVQAILQRSSDAIGVKLIEQGL